MYAYGVYSSPFGRGYLLLAGETVRLLTLPGTTEEGFWRLARQRLGVTSATPLGADHPVVREVEEFLTGRRRGFSFAVDPPGTPFQRAVWRVLLTIPYGTMVSYGEIARRLGRPRAARAVGAACRANPIALVIPCHRVVGADGSLTGFGGGLTLKEHLLRLEQRKETPSSGGNDLLQSGHQNLSGL
ncbi:MAG: methylated-DNA--[protein]-cysteine S-methyltransferase [Firmicutes bacterium]|nr:methylated-DNA--[protein]-cysteine S-methyltransferase [Bacillota bacterium]